MTATAAQDALFSTDPFAHAPSLLKVLEELEAAKPTPALGVKHVTILRPGYATKGNGTAVHVIRYDNADGITLLCDNRKPSSQTRKVEADDATCKTCLRLF